MAQLRTAGCAADGPGGAEAVVSAPMPDRAERAAEPLIRLVVRGLSALPRPLQAALAGPRPESGGQVLEPEIALALRLTALLGDEGFERKPLAEARAEIELEARVFRGRRIRVGSVRELEVPGGDGPLRARLYVPAAPTGALVLYLHGGGWTVGSIESHDQTTRFLAAESGATVLSVDYRLAPEHPFPAAPDDALAAFRWAAGDGAASLGCDPGRIALAGDSAGGNLAAVAARLAARDPVPPRMQALIYPVCDSSRKHPSRHGFAEGYFLTDAQMDWYEANYLTGGGDPADPRVSPLVAEDLAGLPPAYLAVAGFDPLRDEALAYAHRLREAGVLTECRLHRGLIHGFANAVGVGRVCPMAMREVAQALRTGLAEQASPIPRASRPSP